MNLPPVQVVTSLASLVYTTEPLFTYIMAHNVHVFAFDKL